MSIRNAPDTNVYSQGSRIRLVALQSRNLKNEYVLCLSQHVSMNRPAISRLYAEAEYMRDLTITKPEFHILLDRRMKNFMAVSAPARLTHVAASIGERLQ